MTDSTAALSAEDAERWGITVVPLDVAAEALRFRDGVDLGPGELADLLGEGIRITTSQPPPMAFWFAYQHAAESGAREVVSVHLSGELSGTVRAAGLAAQTAPLPVHVVDSVSAGMGLGFAALTAARMAEDQPEVGGAQIAAEATRVGRSSAAWFVVDSLDHLRRGGRISAGAAALGTVLGFRPVLRLHEGRIEVAERVRSRRRAARERLVALATAEVGRRAGGTRVAVHHLRRAEIAEELADRLRGVPGVGEVVVREIGAVLGGHLGVGALAVIVTDE